jgi:hypothetical protein
MAINDLKAIGASFSHMLTSVMISRLVLNLRAVADPSPNPQFDGPTATIPMKFMTRAIGNLGGHLETILDDDSHEDDVTLFGFSNLR